MFNKQGDYEVWPGDKKGTYNVCSTLINECGEVVVDSVVAVLSTITSALIYAAHLNEQRKE